ncbi:hypothetical protein SNE25_19730 [Mucilaginibacter sabulilitoris]|uniref:Uncharacterized protein n=1 Tax=Mucilaginibacter sabulilitoris TaxID=1173583 RepID=A0ABZ0TGK9_9SPHI|nr:hypothetical protein [Mucilaginibacter sabulilitoris]WPU91552.1 hypothetical protein SNE25_19730 [Mucilaginibacter sabulilitoris]
METNQLIRMDNMGIVVESLYNAIAFLAGSEDHRNAPVNALGYLRTMFAVTNLDELVERLMTQGATLVGEIVQYEKAYRLCYIRREEGLLAGRAQLLQL